MRNVCPLWACLQLRTPHRHDTVVIGCNLETTVSNQEQRMSGAILSPACPIRCAHFHSSLTVSVVIATGLRLWG